MKTMRFSPSGPQPLRITRHRGFTLVELLAVVAVVGVLVAITIPVVGHARAKADDAVCLTRFREIGTAITLYMADHRGVLPGPLTDGRVCGWYAQNTAGERGTMGGRLQPYISTPPPTTKGRDYPDVFKCPAIERNPQTNKAVSDSGAIISKVINTAVPIDGAPGGVTVNPFGKGNDDTLASNAAGTSRPLAYAALANCPLAHTFAIRECSAANTSYTPASTFVPHGNTLNALFFDWHVGKLDAATLNPL